MSLVNLDELDFEELVGSEGYEYKLSSGSSGLQIHIKTCPNCGSDDWKVYANADSGLGNCFKCNFTFNKLKFIKTAKGFLSNAETFKYLGNLGDTVRYRPKAKKIVSLKINKEWKLPLNRKILSVEDIPDYLKQRNIDLKLATRFDLRVCDYGFYTYQNIKGNTAAVDFSQRIMIPIKDIDGNYTTFQGRDITGNAPQKYLFPNMLPSAGSYIYNADYALKNNYKKIVLNEGAFDVYATTQALEGDVTFSEYCACGTFGKHLGIDRHGVAAKDQLGDLYRLRQNGLDEIVMLWDGENKAIIAAMETALELEELGFNVKVGILPKDCDPAETTPEEVRRAIKEAQKVSKLSLIKYRITYA